MKFIYGTKNISKINHMKHILRDMHIEIESLGDVTEPEEVGASILDNAKIKALHYYKQVGRPVFSCDSGLFFENVNPEDQPGKYIRRINGRSLTDDEMIDHYSQVAKKYGGHVIARYHNAICLVIDEDHIISYDGDDLNSEAFKIVEKPHSKRKEGFPLDALSVDIESGSYYDDLQDYVSDDNNLDKGFQDFFMRVLSPQVKLKFEGYSEIVIKLYPYYAPETVGNFIDLIQSGYYDDKSLCRSVPGRLIQSGDTSLEPKAWTDDTPGYILNGEFNRRDYVNPLGFTRGTIGMAMAAYHETDYATAGSFFIMTKDEDKLNSIVPAFGRVVRGMFAVDELNALETHNEYGYDAPLEPIAIEYIKVDTKGIKYPSPRKLSFELIK